jgi:ankyrin repeat protein
MQRRAVALGLTLWAWPLRQALAGSYDDFFKAIRTDDAQTIEQLIHRGFDPNTLSDKLVHPLTLAIQEDMPKVVAVLIQTPRTQLDHRNAAGETALMIASLRGRPAWVLQMIGRGASVNQTGWTALHYAATSGHTGIIQMLLEAHAYIDAESPNGSTPLMMAAQYGTPEAVKMLLQAGADPTLKNQLGLTALDFAKLGNRPDSTALVSTALGVWGSK